MKKVFVSFLILLLILVVGVLVAPGFINWNSYKAEITAAAKRAIGRDVTITGDISVKLVPSPTVSVSGLRLANVIGGDTQAFAEIRKADVRVAFLPLLGGKVKIESVYLEGPNILLEKLADGRVNWTFGKPAADTTKSQPLDPSASFAKFLAQFELSLERLEIRAGSVRYVDHQSGVTQTLTDLQAVASLKSLTGPFRTRGEATYRGLRTGFDLQLGRLRDGLPMPLSLVLKLPDLPGSAGSFSGRLEDRSDHPRLIGNLKLAIAKPQVLADRLNFGPLPILARQAANFQGALNFAGDTLEFRRLVTTLGDLRLEGRAKVTLGKVPLITANLGLGNLNLDDLTKKFSLAADKKRRGKARKGKSKKATSGTAPGGGFWPLMPVGIIAKVKLHADGLILRRRLIRQGRLEVNLQDGVLNITNLSALLPGGSDFSLSGRLNGKSKRPRLVGQVEFGSSNFRNFLQWLGVKVAAAPGRLNNFVMTAGFSADDQLLRLSRLKTRLDNSNINGGGSLRLQARPSFGLNLQIDKLNLDDYFGDARTPAKPARSNAKSKTAVTKSRNSGREKNGVAALLAGLRHFDANIRLNLGELIFQRRRYQGVRLDASIFNGTATIKRASIANFAGGPLRLNGKVQGGANGKLTLRASYRAASLLGLTRLFKFQTPFNPARLRNIGADVDLSGNLRRLNMSVRLAASGLAITGAGQIFAITDRPRVNLTLAMKHPSLAQISKIFALGIVPTKGADGPVEITAKLKGDASLLATEVKLKLAGGETALQGEVSGLAAGATYNLSISTRHDDVVRLLRGLGVPAKRLAKVKRVLLLANLVGDLDKFQISNLTGSIGDTVLTGGLSGILRKPRPMINADFKFGRIQLEPYLETLRKTGKAGKAAKQQAKIRQWSKEFIDLSVMRLVDAKVTLAVEQIQWRSLLLKRNRAQIRLDNGLARFKVSAASVHGGSVALDGTLSARDTVKKQITGEVNFSADKVRLRQVLRAFGGIDSFSGIASIKGKLRTRGNNEWSIIRALFGALKFSARNGAIEGVDLQGATEILANPVNVFAMVRGLTGAFERGRTEFITMTGDFKIARGIARTGNVKAKFKFGDATAAGRVDLPRWYTNMTAKIQFKGLVRPLPLPIVIKGPLDKPKVSVSEDAVGTFLGNTVIGIGTAPITILKETGKAIGGALDALLGSKADGEKKKKQ